MAWSLFYMTYLGCAECVELSYYHWRILIWDFHKDFNILSIWRTYCYMHKRCVFFRKMWVFFHKTLSFLFAFWGKSHEAQYSCWVFSVILSSQPVSYEVVSSRFVQYHCCVYFINSHLYARSSLWYCLHNQSAMKRSGPGMYSILIQYWCNLSSMHWCL